MAGLLAGFTACGGETPSPETPAAPTASPSAEAAASASAAAASAEPVKAPEPPPPAKKTAKEIVEAGGTFAFSLADSAEAKKAADEQCEKKAKKDAKKLEACEKEVADSAAGEGIRFEKDKDGKLVWTSYGAEKGKEVVLIKVALKIDKADGAKLTLVPDGKAEGKMAKKGPAPKEMLFEVDESTIKMTDPMGKKGVLVYKKK